MCYVWPAVFFIAARFRNLLYSTVVGIEVACVESYKRIASLYLLLNKIIHC
jgi:hypothetical protein